MVIQLTPIKEMENNSVFSGFPVGLIHIRRIEFCKDPEKRKKKVELEKEYNIEHLSKRRKRSLLGYMYKQSKEEINQVNRKCDRILRSNSKILLQYKFPNLTKLHNSPFYPGVKL